MREEITINQAIKKGHLMVNVPVFVCIFGIPALFFFLYIKTIIPGWVFGLSFLIGFASAWLVWSLRVTKWRIWAFENVSNVHELKKRAIQENLIWNDGNIFEKTEIRTSQDKIKVTELEKKFEFEDVYKEDHTLPLKTEIYYSKVHTYSEFGLVISIIVIWIYSLFIFVPEGLYYWVAILCVLGLYGAIKTGKKVFTSKPQIVIDDKGIFTKNTGFIEWKNITDELISCQNNTRGDQSFLTFFYSDIHFEKINTNSLTVKPRELENMLKTYRIRNEK